LGEHPVARLMACVFEGHDRERFDVIGVSLQPKEMTPTGQRVTAAFSQFIDVSALSDREAVNALRDLEIDVAVDLMGFTSASRTGLFSARVAPLQVNFLGCPGTLGAPYYDYILADEQVIPEAQRKFYQERVVSLPGCFQPREAVNLAESTPVSRATFGLPEHGFVFCCFNASYKITPATFDSWMRILAKTPDSVLLLLGENATVIRNLRREAASRGVAVERLVFCGRVSYADYLARFAAADLFLDTLPYNAGTTAGDALAAGLPVLTYAGSTFAARMGASLLEALGLPELIAYRRDQYEALAHEFATTPALAAQIGSKLAHARRTSHLFDTPRYVRYLEAAFRSMIERHRHGQEAESFAIQGTPV
jgi:predicted O-linked N-acetylglucosamine transferase (SPINDLY family)